MHFPGTGGLRAACTSTDPLISHTLLAAHCVPVLAADHPQPRARRQPLRHSTGADRPLDDADLAVRLRDGCDRLLDAVPGPLVTSDVSARGRRTLRWSGTGSAVADAPGRHPPAAWRREEAPDAPGPRAAAPAGSRRSFAVGRRQVDEARQTSMVQHCPASFAGDAQLVELGVQVVDEVQRHRFQRHRFYRRAEFLLALVPTAPGAPAAGAGRPREVGDRGAALRAADRAPGPRGRSGAPPGCSRWPAWRPARAALPRSWNSTPGKNQVAVQVAIMAAYPRPPAPPSTPRARAGRRGERDASTWRRDARAARGRTAPAFPPPDAAAPGASTSTSSSVVKRSHRSSMFSRVEGTSSASSKPSRRSSSTASRQSSMVSCSCSR